MCLLGLSGGVDSSVAAALIHNAIGDQLTPVFVNNGLLRQGEAELVQEVFARHFGMHLVYRRRCHERFLDRLEGVTDPEEKRKIIGDEFVRVFEREAEQAGSIRFPGPGHPLSGCHREHHRGHQSRGQDQDPSQRRRAAGGHEVRACSNRSSSSSKMKCATSAKSLGLPDEIVWRQPFPGPGLAVRMLGEVTEPWLELLRQADAIVREEIEAAGLAGEIWQYFAVLLPVNSVGVMGDFRTYGRVCAIRAVASQDAMTADWARLPYDVLGQNQQPHRERSARHQPRGLRHLQRSHPPPSSGSRRHKIPVRGTRKPLRLGNDEGVSARCRLSRGGQSR